MDESQDFFHDAWAEIVIKKLSEAEKKSVSQVSKAARNLVHRVVQRLCINDIQIFALDRFANLEHLQITGPLHDLRNLEGACISSLTIQHNSLSDRDIDLIATITTLRRLDFQHSTISDLGAISRLCGLKELNLDHVPYISKIDDLSRLSILTDLTTLSVGHSDVDRTALYDFKDFFPVLKEINMAYSSLLTHSGARFRFNFFPHLVSLTLDGYADMRDLTPLEHLTHFKSFAFRDCGLKNEWLTSLSFVTDLESLALSRNTNLNDEGMQHLLVLRSLRTLECNQLQNVTSLGMGSMISLLTQLTRLEVINTGVDVHQLGQTDESLCIVV